MTKTILEGSSIFNLYQVYLITCIFEKYAKYALT